MKKFEVGGIVILAFELKESEAWRSQNRANRLHLLNPETRPLLIRFQTMF
ncbi:1517_t:CDS:2 [Ambispora leptoticha]|uniref:1517_t:CDS:1 n=1 Tax=Ambispora leptoticha TaxID=144679 RepID=A0A9N8ZAI3_9GLOM|nr:1517_t:CDS:2 [Ambispora leptoticha]